MKFTAPWCGHCRDLKGKFDLAAETLVPEGIGMFDVNTEENEDLGERFEITSFPTLFVFRRGGSAEGTKYTWRRETADIIDFMRAKLRPVRELVTAEEVAAFVGERSMGMIGVFEEWETPAAKSFRDTAEEQAVNMRFAKAAPHLLADHGAPNAVFFVRYQPTLGRKDAVVVRLPGEEITDAAALTKLAAANLPPIKLLDDSLRMFSKEFNKPMIMLHTVVDKDHDAGFKKLTYVVNRFKKAITSKYSDAFDFYVRDITGKEQELQDQFGVVITDGQAVTAVVDGKRYGLAAGVQPGGMGANAAAVGQFLAGVESGELEPHVKSEPIPTDEGALQHLVGQNFKKVVGAGDKDHFLMFHAPWCGHCKAAKPDWEKFAVAMRKAGVKTLQISMYDATNNDKPDGFKIESFPTFYFVPAGQLGQPIAYEGDRSFDAWVEFAEKHAKHPFKPLVVSKAYDEL